MKQASPCVQTRRGVLAGVGAVGAATAFATVPLKPPTSSKTLTKDHSVPLEPDGQGYRLTEHIKRYYTKAST